MNIALFIISFCFVSEVFATFESDVYIFYSKGENYAINSIGQKRSIQKNSQIRENEILITSDESFLILKIGKHSTHRIEENSEVHLTQLPIYFEESDDLEQGASFFLKMGTVFSEIFKKSEDESFAIQTRNTTIGVRGTKLMASIDEEENDLWLAVDEGVVEVENLISQNRDIVEKDESIVIEKDRQFTGQKKYKWQQNLSWNIEGDKENFRSFKKLRKNAYKEFLSRRVAWKRNQDRWADFQKKREQRLSEFREKTKKFKSKKSKKDLKQDWLKKRNNFINKKSSLEQRSTEEKQKLEHLKNRRKQRKGR